MANHLRCLAVALILFVALPVAAQGRRPVRPHWLNLRDLQRAVEEGRLGG